MKHPTPHFDPPAHHIVVPLSEMVYVGFWARFVAFLIDSLVATIVIAPLVYVVLGEVDPSQYEQSDPAALLALLYELSLRLSVDTTLFGVLVVLFWIFRSATPGKMAVSAIILRAEDGGKPRPFQLVIRYLGYFISLFPLGLGFLWIAVDRRKQGWHDMISGTVVVSKPRRRPGKEIESAEMAPANEG